MHMASDNHNSPVRAAVVGLGMGGIHTKTLLASDEAEIVGLADLDQERLDAFVDQVPASALFTDYKEMLEQVQPDLTIIALPNFLHRPVTLDALAAGSHVLCEKPMAMTVAEAEEMKAAAEAAGKFLGINFSQRFTADHRALKALAESGDLGQIYHAYVCWTRRDGIPGFGGWFGQKKVSGGGPLIDLGVHRLDMAMWLMGNPEVIAVSGATHSNVGIPRAIKEGKNFDVEDYATGFVRFANGASLILEVSWAGHQGRHQH